MPTAYETKKKADAAAKVMTPGSSDPYREQNQQNIDKIAETNPSLAGSISNTLGYNVGSPIVLNPDQISGAKPYTLPPATPQIESTGLEDFIATSVVEPYKAERDARIKELQKKQEGNMGAIERIYERLGESGEVEENIYQKEGVDVKRRALDEVTNEIEAEQRSMLKKISELEKNPQGLFGGALQSEIERVRRESISKQADLAIIQSAASRAYDTASSVAERKFNSEMEPLRLHLEALKFFYTENKADLNKEEDRAYQEMLTKEERTYNEAYEDRKSLKDTKLELLKNAGIQDAPLDVLRAIQNAQTVEEAITAAGQYGASPEQLADLNELYSTGMTPEEANNFLKVTTDYQKDAVILSGQRAAQSIDIANRVLSDPANAGNQLSVLYTLVKGLDQDSAVREGELDLAGQTQSLAGKLEREITKVGKGQVLSEQSAKELAATVKALAGDWQKLATKRKGQFQSQANVVGLGEQFESYLSGFESNFGNEPPVQDPRTQAVSEMIGKGGEPGDIVNRFLQPNSPVRDTVLKLQSAQVSPEKIIERMQALLGTQETMSNGPVSVTIPKSSRLAYVNNNPGNLRFAGQEGATKGEKGFAKFATPEAGVQALINQIGLDASRGLTLAQFVSKYAPPHENDTATYLRQIQHATGAKATTPLHQIPTLPLVRAIAKKESSSTIG